MSGDDRTIDRRDAIALEAMKVILAKVEDTAEHIAEYSYKMADAMLKARVAPTQEPKQTTR